MDSHQRTLLKTLTYRLLGTASTAGLAWLMTREVCLAASLGLLDLCLKLGGYYLHERLWELTSFGRGSTCRAPGFLSRKPRRRITNVAYPDSSAGHQVPG